MLKLPIRQMFDEQKVHSALIAAVKRAEERFTREYRSSDPELTDALMAQTRFTDVPGVQAALREMLIHPLYDPNQSVAIIQSSFSDVLPTRVDCTRVDAASTAFLHYLGQEVLHILQLQDLYALAFQKVSAESSRSIAANTATLVESVRDLRDDSKQLPASLSMSALPASSELQGERTGTL